MQDVYIIAEAGVNHNGSFELAIQLIDEAKKAGANAVKFQTFVTENCLSKTISKAAYQVTNTGSGSQFDMVKKLELSFKEHSQLKAYCDEQYIDYLSTGFDFDSLAFLVDELKLKTLKIASGEVTNAPLVLAHAQSGCDIILSTGMCTLGDIEKALGILAFGFIGDTSITPSDMAFTQAYFSDEGQALIKKRVTILHCTTEYPAPFDEINLKAINTIKRAFGTKIGYSDHSQGIAVPIMAVAFGVTMIEKHFTLDKTMEGPDHIASLDPSELKDMISGIRQGQSAIGGAFKRPSASELGNLAVVRKVILANHNIKKGEVFSKDNLSIKRGAGMITPTDYWALLGRKSRRDYAHDEPLVNELHSFED